MERARESNARKGFVEAGDGGQPNQGPTNGSVDRSSIFASGCLSTQGKNEMESVGIRDGGMEVKVAGG